MIGPWLLAWGLSFGFGINFCTVELRKYVDPGSGSGSGGWVRVWVWVGSAKVKD